MNNLTQNILFKTSTIADGNMSFRIGDTDNSLKNRKQFLLKNGIDFNNHICMKCDHGEQIIAVNRDTQTIGAETQKKMILSEVLITQEKGLALMLLTADCLPISLHDPVTKTIVLAHFSRETISKMLPQKTIGFLREHFTVNPANLIIQIGPHIHAHSYRFPLPLEHTKPAIKPFIKEIDEYAEVDLLSACTHQLTTAGVFLENISVSKINTATSPDHFSYYQSKKQNTQEGRMATILMMY